MTNWSKWKKLVDEDKVLEPENEPRKPGTYQIGRRHFLLASLFDIGPKYVGETDSLRRRISNHANGYTHLQEKIKESIEDGYVLYYRRQKKSSSKEAKKKQDELLQKHEFDWNDKGD